MAAPTHGNQGFFRRLWDRVCEIEEAMEEQRQADDKALVDAVFPHLTINPFADSADAFNAIIQHLDQPSIEPEGLKLQLNTLKANHADLLDWATTGHLDRALRMLETVGHAMNPDDKALLATLSGGLKKMRLANAGYLSTTYRFSTAEKELTLLRGHLAAIQAFFNGSLQKADLSHHTQEAKKLLIKLNEEQPRFFYNQNVSTKDQQAMQAALDAFTKFSSLPASLQSLCLTPDLSQALPLKDLSNSIDALMPFLNKAISSQQSVLGNAATQVKHIPKLLLEQGLEGITREARSPASFIRTLHETLEFFLSDASAVYTPEEKNAIGLSLTQKCNLTLPHFLDYFTQPVYPLSQGETIFDYPSDVRDSFLTALQASLADNNHPQAASLNDIDAIIQYCDLHRLTSIGDDANAVDNARVVSLNTILDIFSHLGSPSLGLSAIPFMQSFLSSAKLRNWVERQTPETQDVARTFITRAENIVNAASTYRDASEITRAFEQLKELYRQYHISLDGFPLPACVDNPALLQAKAEEAVETVQQMRRSLDAADPKRAPSQELTPAQRTTHIEGQTKLLGQNLKDLLTFKIIGKSLLGKDDHTFYAIKQAQLSLANQNSEEYFYNEMKREVSQSSLNWFVKKGVLLLFPFIYRFVGRYTQTAIENFHSDFNGRVASLNKNRLLSRATNCLSQYNAMLKEWAFKPEGGDKDLVIGALMQDKRFLTFGNVQLSQQELYAKLSSMITEEYLDLFKGPEGNIGPSHYFTGVKARIKAFINRPLLSNRRGFIANSLNKLSIGAKAIFLGAPAYLLTFVASLPVYAWEKSMNFMIRKAAQYALGNFQILNAVADSAKKDVFENNHYVYPITSFFADQLETLSKKFAEMKVSDDKKTDDSERVVISDKSREEFKKLLESLFEVIKKNQYSTQDSLKAFLDQTTGIAQVKEDIDGFISSKLINGVIDMIFKAYNKFLTEENLQGSFLRLLETLNQNLLKEQNQTEDKRRAEHLKHQMAQEKLTKYSEKVLHQVIDHAINMGLDQFNHHQSSTSTHLVKWLKDELKDKDTALLVRYEELKQRLEDHHISLEDKLQELEKFKDVHNAFQLNLESKLERLMDGSSSVAQELKAQLQPIMAHLKTLLEDGLLKLLSSQKELVELSNDKPHFDACRRALDTLAASLEAIDNDLDDDFSNHKATLLTQYDFLKRYLPKIRDLDPQLELKKATEYEDIQDVIRNNFEPFKQHLDQSIKSLNALDSLVALQEFSQGIHSDHLAELVRLKKEALAHGGLYHMLHRGSLEELTTLSRRIKERLNTLPVLEDHIAKKELVKQHVEALINATSPQVVDNVAGLIQAINLNQDIANCKDTICEKFEASKDALEPISEGFNTLENEYFTVHIEEKADSYNEAIAALQDQINYLEGACHQLQPMQFIDGELGIAQGVKNVPHAVMYHAIKPKMQGILDLLRSGNFAQFLVNHAVVMPLVTK